MIDDLTPYAAMKDSGVECLGEVPEHWEVTKLGHWGAFFKGNGGTKEDAVPAGIPCIRYGDLYTRHEYIILKANSFVSQVRAKDYTPIKFGDVLFAASGETIEEIGKSAVNLMQSEACCGGDVILFRPNRKVDARYIGYVTDCVPSALQKATMGRGITVMHVYGDQLKRLCLALPPLREQTAIAQFLDHAGRRIRRYIRAKQKLIALLEEQKQALIHQAVTGQIDVRTGTPYPAYKDSGVEWLGTVPAHWEVRHLGRIGTLFKGVGGTKEDERESGVPCVRYGDLYTHHRFFITAGRACVSAELAAMNYTPLLYGDVLFAGSGETIDEIGKSAVNLIRGIACCGGDIIIFRPSIDADPRFLGYASDCTASARQKACMGRGFTVMHIYSSDLKYMAVAIPSLVEQTTIAHNLNKATADTDSAIKRSRQQIDLLREYRTRLIADVVTGKLDVRDLTTELPEVDPLAAEDLDDTIDADVDSNLDEHDAAKEVTL